VFLGKSFGPFGFQQESGAAIICPDAAKESHGPDITLQKTGV